MIVTQVKMGVRNGIWRVAVAACVAIVSVTGTSQCLADDDESKSTFVFNALVQQLEVLSTGEVTIEWTRETMELSNLDLEALKGREIQPKLERTEILYAFDFKLSKGGNLRVEAETEDRLTKYVRNADYSSWKTWDDGKSTHAVTKLLPDATPGRQLYVFDIRCVGMTTAENLIGGDYSLRALLEALSAQPFTTQRTKKGNWVVESELAAGSVRRLIHLDDTLGFAPVQLEMFRRGSDLPFATVKTKWTALRNVLVPSECVSTSQGTTTKIVFTWKSANEQINPDLFDLESFDIGERTLVVDRRLNEPIIEEILNNDRPAKQSDPLRPRSMRWVSIALTCAVIFVLLILLWRRRTLLHS